MPHVTVPDGCVDRVIPLSDPRARALTHVGIGLVGVTRAATGFDWPVADPLTHLLLGTVSGAGRIEVGRASFDLGVGALVIAPARVQRRFWAVSPTWEFVAIRVADLPRWSAFHQRGVTCLFGGELNRLALVVEAMLAEVRAPSAVARGRGREQIEPRAFLEQHFAARMNWDVAERRTPVTTDNDPFALYARALRAQVERLARVDQPEASRSERLDALWDLVASDLGRRWTVAELARAANVSRATLHREVTVHEGSSPGEVVRNLRLDESAHLLAHGDVPVGAIARRLGYANPFAFSAAFKRRFAVSPSEFRSRVRAESGDAPDG